MLLCIVRSTTRGHRTWFHRAHRFYQGLTGQISGTIADPSGAAVPNASIELRNRATAPVRQASTDNSGAFLVTNPLPGAGAHRH